MLSENVYWTLDCSGCYEVFRSSHKTKQAELDSARAAGWTCDEKNQVCPKCQRILTNLQHVIFISEDVPS